MRKFVFNILLICLVSFCGASSLYSKDVDDSQFIEVTGSYLRKLAGSFRGKKGVLLNVWATHCPPCLEELPHLVKLRNKYINDIEVILVCANLPENEEAAVTFLKKHGVTWKTYLKNEDGKAFVASLKDGWTGAIPATLIVNKAGKETAFIEGARSYEEFERLIREAIAQR